MNYLAACRTYNEQKKLGHPIIFHHRVTESTETNKDGLFFLCVLCDSSERSERVVKMLTLLTKQASGNKTLFLFDSMTIMPANL
jgi:hypothetical protein